MNIAFLTTRMDKPSYRFRVGQFIPFLERNGAACSTFVIPRPGPARWRLLLGLRRHDAVFLQKKLLGPFDRALLSRSARRLVYDIDDAVMRRKGDGALRGSRMRRFRATARMSDLVLAGKPVSGAVRLRVLSRAHSSGETWDSAPASTLAAATCTIGGSNGQMMRLSHTWSTGYSAGERATLVLVRDGDNSSDVMSGTAQLLSARVVFPTAQ